MSSYKGIIIPFIPALSLCPPHCGVTTGGLFCFTWSHLLTTGLTWILCCFPVTVNNSLDTLPSYIDLLANLSSCFTCFHPNNWPWAFLVVNPGQKHLTLPWIFFCHDAQYFAFTLSQPMVQFQSCPVLWSLLWWCILYLTITSWPPALAWSSFVVVSIQFCQSFDAVSLLIDVLTMHLTLQLCLAWPSNKDSGAKFTAVFDLVTKKLRVKVHDDEGHGLPFGMHCLYTGGWKHYRGGWFQKCYLVWPHLETKGQG